MVIPSNGIDISTSPNTKARAIFEGEVYGIYAILGANYVVIITHGEYLSVYQNLAELQVKAGDHVSVKQELGTVHEDSDEAILHQEIWKTREILNPRSWLSK